MSNVHDSPHSSVVWPGVANAALRVAFGIIWAVDAALTWTPQFAAHYVGYLHNASLGQPAWAAWWFAAWINLVTPHATLFIWLTRLTETALAAALLLGFARKSLYIVGVFFSLLIWSTAGGFGGPYTVGATNIGPAIGYVLIFIALIIIDECAGPSPYSVDYLIERRWPRWRRISEWSHQRELPSTRSLPWRVQAAALLGIVLLLFVLLGGLYSTVNVNAPSPAAAAAAVSPLSLASSKPIAHARDARLPPLQPGPSVNVHFIVTDQKVEIASGVYYQAWTYNDTVPGPTIHVRQGQTVNMTLTNNGTMEHSIDFHAAQVAPNRDFVDIDPGQSIHFSFVARVPGAFIYHCGTAPILLHLGNGMYGALIVSPKKPLPAAAESYVLVQSEWYTQQISGTLMGADYKKMLQKRPDEVVFNGAAFQYVAHPLPVTAGKRLRLYFVNAGPNLWTSFHVVGAIINKVYSDGDPTHARNDASTYTVGPGEGAIFDLIIKEPGKYSFVDHDLANLMIGAHGIFDVLAPGTISSEATAAPVASSSTPKMLPMNSKAASDEPSGPYRVNPERGASLFANKCAVCHQSTGLGVPGAFPPLKGDPSVLNPDPTRQIHVILHGLHGESVGGTVYPATMPSFGLSLSDSEIADIINYERSSWGNSSKLVTADEVKAERSKAAPKQ